MSTNKVLVNRRVVFVEHVFPFLSHSSRTSFCLNECSPASDSLPNTEPSFPYEFPSSELMSSTLGITSSTSVTQYSGLVSPLHYQSQAVSPQHIVPIVLSAEISSAVVPVSEISSAVVSVLLV